MDRFTLNILLLILTIAVISFIVVLPRDYTERNTEFLPGMLSSVPSNAFSENVNFRDKKTLQLPPSGTIAFGFAPMEYNATPEDAIRAGEELNNKFSKDSTDVIERGTIVFATFCSPCHGAGGNGDGNVAQRGFPPPPSLFLENAMKIKDGQMFHIISFGKNAMPNFSSQISRDDRWKAIAYIRSLQEKKLVAGVK